MPETPKTDHRVAIFMKGSIVGTVGIWSNGTFHQVASCDPRCNPPIYFRQFNTAQDANDSYNEHIAVTRDRGWTVIHNGRPNFG